MHRRNKALFEGTSSPGCSLPAVWTYPILSQLLGVLVGPSPRVTSHLARECCKVYTLLGRKPDIWDVLHQADYLTVTGKRVYYVTEGSGEPVLLLHGGLGSVEDFAFQIPVLAKHFRVIAFERSGHGHTADTDETFTFESMVNQTASFIETLGLGAASVVGWSDGAIIALFLAISRPELVRKVVTVSGLIDTMVQSAETRRWIESATPDSFPKSRVKRYGESSPDGPAHFPTVLEKTKKLWLNEPKIKSRDLAAIKAPTLVMASDNEDIPIEHTLEIFRAIKGAQLCIIPGTTHFLMSEKPELVNQVIIAFLGQPADT